MLASRSRAQVCTVALISKSSRLRWFSSQPALRQIDFIRDHKPIASPANTTNFIGNAFVPSKSTTFHDVHDPATNNVVTRVPQSTDEELNAAVESAERAFPAWKSASILTRQTIMFNFVSLIKQNWDRLAASITLEQGKTFADAKGDVLRGLQVAETACGITTQLTGEALTVAKDMETRTIREPIGVVAAICPFSAWNDLFPRRLTPLPKSATSC